MADFVTRDLALRGVSVSLHTHVPLASHRLGVVPTRSGDRSTCHLCGRWIIFSQDQWVLDGLDDLLIALDEWLRFYDVTRDPPMVIDHGFLEFHARAKVLRLSGLLRSAGPRRMTRNDGTLEPTGDPDKDAQALIDSWGTEIEAKGLTNAQWEAQISADDEP